MSKENEIVFYQDAENTIVLNTTIMEKIAEEARGIDLTNIESIEEAKNGLVKIRGLIQSQGKSQREEHIAINKNIISEEKKYISMIEPIELEYKKLIADEKKRLIIEVRKEQLPMKKKQLELLVHIEGPTDEDILDMDDAAWLSYYNNVMTQNEEKIQFIQDQEKRNSEIEQEKKDAVAQAVVDAEKNAKQVAAQAKKDKDAAILKAKSDAEEKAVAVKKEMEDKIAKDEFDKLEGERLKKEKEDKEKVKLESDKKYQKFLSENDFDAVTDRVVEKDGVIRIYRLVAEFKK